MKLRLYIDGAARGNPGPAAAGAVIQDTAGRTVAEIAEYLGETTNNVAEYRALLRGLEEATARGGDELEIFADSDLLVRQIKGTYQVKSSKLLPLHTRAIAALESVRRWQIAHVPREENAAADALANRALDERAGGSHETRRAVTGAAPRARRPRDLRGRLQQVVDGLDGTIGIGVK
jgi:ribonuclease HI